MSFLASMGYAGQRAGEEIRYPAKEFAKLDTFEGLNLEDGDKLFAKKDYKGAYAAYKAYSDEFPKGKALAYALLRMGRCLHMLNKRNAAIKAYQDVVDYFPNHVLFAAGALYHMGEAHKQNGDPKKCLSTWAKMVKDKDYVTQPNSGTALMHLSREMDKVKKFEESAGYRWRIAVNFRSSNHHAAHEAKEAVRYHYVVRVPNHTKFKLFYKEVGGWHRHDTKHLKDLDNYTGYWGTAFHTIWPHHHDNQETKDLKIKAASYWVGKFGAKFPKDDGMQKTVIDLRYMVDKDATARVKRMNQQAERGAMSVGRFNWWVHSFKHLPKAQLAFMAKHGKVLSGAKYQDVIRAIDGIRDSAARNKVFTDHLAPGMKGMDVKDQMALLGYFERARMDGPAKAVLSVINAQKATNKQLIDIANICDGLIGEERCIGYLKIIKDKQVSQKAIYDWYYSRSGAESRRRFNKGFAERALALIPELSKNPDYAQGLLWPKARLLDGLQQLPAAIKAYKATNRQPHATWAVVDCLIRMKNYPKAITTVKGLESVGGSVAAQACMKVADIYKLAGNKGKEVEQLRLVLRRYPKQRQSSEAHQRLEAYGAKITGGEAKAED